MKSSLVVLFTLFSFKLMAQVDQRLSQGQLAYYGSGFTTAKISKDLLTKILNEYHEIRKGQPDLISNSCSGNNCYRHFSVGYDTARKILFGELYLNNDSNGNFVQDVYCGKKFYFRNVDEISQMGSEVNIEHTWPQSKFNGNHDKNMQKSDMHHLYPSDSMANNRRGNNHFGDIGNNVDELNVDDCSSSQLFGAGNKTLFSPPKGHRGNVARSLFYFATRYRMTINEAEELILRQWHKVDPVDAFEKNRHEIIAKYQKVRNPFIDYPEMADRISDF